LDAALRAMQLKHPGGSVRDARATSVVLFVSFVRVMVLWILLFVAEKVYQSTYVERALTVAGKVDRSRLPSLWLLMPAVLAVESIVFALLAWLMFSVGGATTTSGRGGAVIDRGVMARVASTYAATTLVLAVLGALLGGVVQCRDEFRYHEDGLRGIRALCVMLLAVSAAVILAAPAVM
jgi:hypothetical protein